VIAYTESQTAIHELGHVLVACALGMKFEYVEIHPAAPPRKGWDGQCRLIPSCGELHPLYLDAFQMGGPLLQLKMMPETLGEHLGLFKDSLFTHSRDLVGDKHGILDEIIWASDLRRTHMLQNASKLLAAHASLRWGFPSPWLLTLEAEVRRFLEANPCQELAQRLSVDLAHRKRLAFNSLSHEFESSIDPQFYQSLQKFVTTQAQFN
jgi:hypothetical protein